MFTLDYSITVGNLIEIASICGGGLLVLIKLSNTVTALGVEIKGMQIEIEKIGGVVIIQTDQNRRILHLEEDLREMRHGQGFIKGPRGVDHEYP